jgi:hypothetical protein
LFDPSLISFFFLSLHVCFESFFFRLFPDLIATYKKKQRAPMQIGFLWQFLHRSDLSQHKKKPSRRSDPAPIVIQKAKKKKRKGNQSLLISRARPDKLALLSAPARNTMHAIDQTF